MMFNKLMNSLNQYQVERRSRLRDDKFTKETNHHLVLNGGKIVLNLLWSRRTENNYKWNNRAYTEQTDLVEKLLQSVLIKESRFNVDHLDKNKKIRDSFYFLHSIGCELEIKLKNSTFSERINWKQEDVDAQFWEQIESIITGIQRLYMGYTTDFIIQVDRNAYMHNYGLSKTIQGSMCIIVLKI